MSGILLHNDTTNESQFWLLDGFKVVARATLLDEDSNVINVGGPWSVVGVGTDQAAITRPNIVWHDQNSNMILLWRMLNHKISSRVAVLGEDGKTAFVVRPPWNIVGVGDFGGNGKADILWHNTNGQSEIWFMDDDKVVGSGIVGRHRWKATSGRRPVGHCRSG